MNLDNIITLIAISTGRESTQMWRKEGALGRSPKKLFGTTSFTLAIVGTNAPSSFIIVPGKSADFIAFLHDNKIEQICGKAG